MKLNKFLKIMTVIIIVFVMSFGCFSLAKDAGKDEFGAVPTMIAGFIRNIGFNIFNMLQGGIGTTNNGNIVTTDDLVFDHFGETSIDFYNSAIDPTSFIGNLKSQVSEWYNKFRGIAITCYLIILLYIAINIMISTAGKKQEKYKEFLIAWGQGLILLFFFPYLLRFAINVNHAFVRMIEQETSRALNIYRTSIPGNYERYIYNINKQ